MSLIRGQHRDQLTVREAQQELQEINERNLKPMTPIEELRNKITDLIGQIQAEQSTTLDEARKALNEAGIGAARSRVMQSLEAIEQAQMMLREQQEVERQMRSKLEQAIADAEWELDGRFVTEGTKTWLTEGEMVSEDGTRTPIKVKSLTADERKDYKAREARHTPGVQQAEAAHRSAASDLDACKDAVAHADRSFSAAKADLTAAVATVQLLAQSLGGN